MSEAANDNRGPDKNRDGKVATRKCPICGKPETAEAKPFCSKRCADVDLHRWLGETYRVPAAPDSDMLLPDEED